MELPEGAFSGVHGGVVLPCLGNHHQHGVGQAATAEVQQFEYFVEGRRVGCLRCADRREPGQVAGDLRAGQHGLAGVHAVAVAAHGVDLTVVGDEAERMGQRPGGERVGGEPAVHDRDRAHTAFVSQVRKVLGQLHCREHALVDHGAAGQRRKVHAVALGALAQWVDPTVEVDAADALRCGDEQLRHEGHAVQCGLAYFGAVGVDGHRAPPEDMQPFFVGDGLNVFASFRSGDPGPAGGSRYRRRMCWCRRVRSGEVRSRRPL